MRCPSVKFETNRHIFKLFSPSSIAILVFPYRILWQYSDGDPLTGVSNARGIGITRDSQPISGSIAYCEPFEHQVLSCVGPYELILIAGKRRSLLMAGDDDEM